MCAFFVHCACAETFAPELAPLAQKYRADVAALDGQRIDALAQARKTYSAALATAEKTASTAGNAAGLAAITTERTSLESGLMAPDFPPGLPKELQSPRKTFLETQARLRAAEAPRRQAIDTAYLRALASLEARAGKNSDLLKQVQAERQNVVASTPAAGGSKTNMKNAVINGSFDLADENGHPKGWTTHDSFKVQRNGTNNVLHVTAEAPEYKEIDQEIAVPPKARNVVLSERVRGKWDSSDPKQSLVGTRTTIQFIGADGQKMNSWIILEAGREAGWKTLTKTDRIPEGSKSLVLSVALSYIAGKFDFDDLEVEFR